MPKNSENNPKADTLPYLHSEGAGASKPNNRGEKRKNRGGSQPPASSKGAGKGKGEIKTDKNGHHIKTRENKEICFAFAKGERGVCPDPCADNRAHVCMICLQPHRNAACTKKA